MNKFIILVLIALAPLLASASSQVGKCHILGDINACSTPYSSFPFTTTFEPACVFHDSCYRCGERYGYTQKQCDDTFRINMETICEREANATQRRNYYFRTRRAVNSMLARLQLIYSKLVDGWKKATMNQTKTEEAKRLWQGTLEIFSLSTDLLLGKFKDYKTECDHAVKVYSRAVEVLGIYNFRGKSPDYCQESCAQYLADPARRVAQVNVTLPSH